MPQPPSSNDFVDPGKPVLQAYPTPNLADRILVERKDARKPDYEAPPEPGSEYQGRDADKYEGFVFAKATPIDQVGWQNWYWLNERANQEAYNYSVAYPWNDKDYPAVTRTYVFLRDDLLLPETLAADPILASFEEPQANTADPVFTDLQLTDHKQVRLEDPILDSLFVGIERVFEKLPGPVITIYSMNEFQQPVTTEVREVQDGEDTFIAPDALTEIAKTERTGTAKARYQFGNVNEVFRGLDVTVQKEESVLPYKFRTDTPSVQTIETVAGTVNENDFQPEDLSAGQWLKQGRQVTKFKKLLRTIARAFGVDGRVLIGERLTRDGQIATVTETLRQADQHLAVNDPLLIDGDVETLGAGHTLMTEVEVSSVFPNGRFQTEIPDLVPEEFRATAPLVTTSVSSAGTATNPPVLGTGDISKVEEQIRAFVKRVTTATRAAVTFPQTLIQHETTTDYGGGDLIVESTIDDSIMTIDEGLLVVSSSVKDLGNGLWLKVSRTLNDTEWPVVHSELWDEEMRIQYDQETQVVAEGTAADNTDPGIHEEVKGQDKWRSVRIRNNKIANLEAVSEGTAIITYRKQPYTFPGRLDLGVYTAYGAAFSFQRPQALLVQTTIKTWWEDGPTAPIITQDDIFTGSITLDDNTYDNTLHDGFTYPVTGYVLPATSPTYTDFVTNWIGTLRIIGANVSVAKENGLWKVETQSVIMR